MPASAARKLAGEGGYCPGAKIVGLDVSTGRRKAADVRALELNLPETRILSDEPLGEHKKQARHQGLACPAPALAYLLRMETISITFASLPSTVLYMFMTIMSLLSTSISSRPCIFWPVSGQHSSLAQTNFVPEPSQEARPWEIVPHRPQTRTAVNFFWALS